MIWLIMLTHGMRALFLAQSSITALAPSQVVNRVTYPSVFVDDVPQGVRCPYVLIRHDSTDPNMTLDAAYHNSGQNDTVEVDSVANTLRAARALNKVVRLFFEDYDGDVTADGITDTIIAVMWQDEDEDSEYQQDGTDAKQFTITTTYDVLVKQGA